MKYTPPPGAELVGGEVDISTETDGYGPNAVTSVAAFTPEFEADGGPAFLRCTTAIPVCSNGISHFSGELAIPADRGGDLYLVASCEGTTGYQCDEGGSDGVSASVRLYSAALRLSNDSTPAATNFSGSLLEGSARGNSELAFLASDGQGPGVYRVTVSSEGTTLYNGNPNESGQCRSVGEQEGVLMFASALPCGESEPVDLPIDSTALTDGSHVLQAIVTDAAGNSSVVLDRTITTANAPEATSQPTLLGDEGAAVGTTLTAEPGTWSAPSGAGSIAYTYKWQRCDKEGEHCVTIADAESSTYTVATSDVGHELRASVIASDTDGTYELDTAPTSVVAEPASSSGGEDGSGSTPAHGSEGGVAGGSSANEDSFDSPALPTAGGNGDANEAVVGTSSEIGGMSQRPSAVGGKARWRVSIHLNRGRVRKGILRLRISGSVDTRPRPRAGKVVYVRMRVVGGRSSASRHASTRHWTRIAALRTRPSGLFDVAPRVRLPRGRDYEVQVVAPREPGYRNATGVSRIVRLGHEPPAGRGHACTTASKFMGGKSALDNDR